MTFSYKRFTIYVMIFTVTLFAVYSYIIINHKMVFMNREYPSYLYVKSIINSVDSKEYNFIAIGDSRMQASFLPTLFDSEDINSINLSLGGSTPIAGYYTIKKYLESNKKPNFILMGYSPAILSGPYFYGANTIKSRLLDDDEYEEVAKNAVSVGDNEIIGLTNYYDYKIYTGKYLTDFINGIIERRWRLNKIVYDYIEKSKGQRYAGIGAGSSDLSSENRFEEFVPSDIIRLYFEKILLEAKEKNIQVYWYSNPINNRSFEALPKGYKEDYEFYLKTMVEKYNLKVLNALYPMAADRFGDHDHVYLGAPEVTKTIKKEFLKAID